MKLDCELVKDLYVSYEVDLLTPRVKTAVEEHLKTCSLCKKIYDTGQGFEDNLNADIQKEVPLSVDEKTMLELKVAKLQKRIRNIIGVLLCIIIFIGLPYGYRSFRNVSNKGEHYKLRLEHAEINLEDFEYILTNMINQEKPDILTLVRYNEQAVQLSINERVDFHVLASQFFQLLSRHLSYASTEQDFQKQKPYLEKALDLVTSMQEDIEFIREYMENKSSYKWYLEFNPNAPISNINKEIIDRSNARGDFNK